MAEVTGAYSRCTAIVSFYDEPLDLLAASISSLAGVVDHVVAVDGAYMLFPEGKPSSDPQQMRLIEEICRGLRIGLTTHTPMTTWVGNEVQKRNHALRLAEAVTSEDGWYYAHDADTVVTHAAGDWFSKLEQIKDELWGAINVGVREVRNLPVQVPLEDTHSPCRLLYRAVRGLHYGPTHWTLRALDPATGEVMCLWGDKGLNPVDAYDGKHLLKVDHRRERATERQVRARMYYARRDTLGVEAGPPPVIRHTDGTIRPVSARG